MTANGLYKFLEERIPKELSCEWDNDGRMVMPEPEKEIKKALICLDASEAAVDYAVENGFDCIVTHHPLVFSPIKNIDADDHLGRKLCKLIKNGICVFSFHMRLDAVDGGVNDVIVKLFTNAKNIQHFSDVGRIFELDCPNKLSLTGRFATVVKELFKTDTPLVCVDGGKSVNKIAVVGGSGKDYLEEAVACGCDTFITGEMPHNRYHDAKELGLNVICLGHYATDNLVCERLKELILEYGDVETEILDTNPTVSR